MSVVPIRIKAFAALRDGQVIIISPGFSYIKKVGSAFTGSDSFAVNTFHFFVIVVVRHCYKFLKVNQFTNIIF